MANEKLAAWLTRSGMSRGELARRVKTKATEWNEPHIAPNTSRVRCWLHGQSPRPPLPDIIAAVFTDHVGFHVGPTELGFGLAGPARVNDDALTYDPSYEATVETLTALGHADINRRTMLVGAPFVALAGVAPSRDWLVSGLDRAQSTGQVQAEDVATLRHMFTEFQRIDVMQGGGSGRLILARYVTEHVYPLLRQAVASPERQSLCEAAAEQTYLLGWMAYDSGEHGVAQRYLIQALRLAEESGSRALGAHVLAGMADQATLLGDPAEGLRLAQAGRLGLHGVDSPACLTDLWCLEARAHALLGNAAAATHAVAESEKAHGLMRAEHTPAWAEFIDDAYLHGEHAITFRDCRDPDAAQEHAQRSIACAAAQQRARRGALSHAALADVFLQRNDLEAAHGAALQTLMLASQVRSARATGAVSAVQQRMQEFGEHHLITDFTDRATAWHTTQTIPASP